MKQTLLITLFFISVLAVNAQSGSMSVGGESYSDTSEVASDARALKGMTRFLREFRFQAYAQVEWQRADSTSSTSYGALGTNNLGSAQGGTFPAYANNRFLLRRGRFKMSYQHFNNKDLKVLDFAFQFDATNVGFTVKDFYGRIIDPWTGWFSLQGGIFLRPFGEETPASLLFMNHPNLPELTRHYYPMNVSWARHWLLNHRQNFKPYICV